jgi:DNA-binding response OmpR family regulator
LQQNVDYERSEPGECEVLLIEDHGDTADVLRLILEGEGYRVERASSASGAIEAFSRARPATFDLILLDLTLPDMNGDKAVHLLRKENGSIPPVLIMCAKSHHVIEAAAQSIGAAGIVRKPFDVELLLWEILSALRTQP